MPLPRRHCLIALLAVAAPALPVQAALAPPPELVSEMPGATARGTGAMRFLGMRVYDARLWSLAAIADSGTAQPLALEITYARKVQGQLIASSSIREMQRVGSVSAEQSSRWLKAMTGLFPDMVPGDRITGVQRPGQSARFYLNGTLRGEVADAEFTRLFFGIWLSPRTSEPGLRSQLLGSAP